MLFGQTQLGVGLGHNCVLTCATILSTKTSESALLTFLDSSRRISCSVAAPFSSSCPMQSSSSLGPRVTESSPSCGATAASVPGLVLSQCEFSIASSIYYNARRDENGKHSLLVTFLQGDFEGIGSLNGSPLCKVEKGSTYEWRWGC